MPREIEFDGDNSNLMSTRSAKQIMDRNPAYDLLNKKTVEAMQKKTMIVYSIAPLGKSNGYSAQRMCDATSHSLMDCMLKNRRGFLAHVSAAMAVHEKEGKAYFIPSFYTIDEEDGLELRFFWFRGEGTPPDRMVTLRKSRDPVPFVPSPSPGRDTVICAVGRGDCMHNFVENVGVAIQLRRHCMHCQRVVSGRNKCSRCRNAFYCDKECQRAHWPAHREGCCSV